MRKKKNKKRVKPTIKIIPFFIPYYIVPWFLCRKVVSKFRAPLKQLGIKLRRDREIPYLIIAMKQEKAAITYYYVMCAVIFAENSL